MYIETSLTVYTGMTIIYMYAYTYTFGEFPAFRSLVVLLVSFIGSVGWGPFISSVAAQGHFFWRWPPSHVVLYI